MSNPCRESDLDALLAGELPELEAQRVGAHAETCAACARTLAWLKMERGWMAQRARRMPPRAALRFEAVEARLRPAAPVRGRWEHWERGLVGAVAAGVLGVMGLLFSTPPPTLAEESWGDGLISVAQVEACTDPSIEAVARVEARVGACLLASPAHPFDFTASWRTP